MVWFHKKGVVMKFVRYHSFITIKGLALIGALAAFAGVAHASTITYNLEGATATYFSDPGTITGTVTIDITTDLVTAEDLTFNEAISSDPVFTNPFSGAISSAEAYSYSVGSNYTETLYLEYYTSNIGIGDLDLDYSDLDLGGTYSAFASGATLDPVSATPEPSSFLLLGTGILGIAGFARRRFLTA